MSKAIIKRIFIAISLIALAVLAYNLFESQKSLIESAYYYWLVSDSKPIPNPNLSRDYPENRTGFYQFNPETILASLDRGKPVFTPLFGNPNDLNVEYDSIAWTQSDFLRVANALSQRVWDERLDLNSWDVYFILASGDCSDNFRGFDDFGITYYKTIKTGWETEYIARHINLIQWMGVAEWEGDGNFSIPFIFGWKNVELTKFKTNAEQAVRIAEDNGGKMARLNTNNKCRISIDIDENVNRNTGGDWLVDYGMTPEFYKFINPFSGEIHSKK